MNQPVSDAGRVAQYVVDAANPSVPVASYATPAGWQSASAVRWRPEHAHQPADVWCRAYDPATGDAFERFPDTVFVWTVPPTTPPGQEASGGLSLPPMQPAEALEKLLIQPSRGKLQGLRLVQARPDPSLLALVPQAPVQGLTLAGIAALVEYVDGGIAFQEEFRAVHLMLSMPPSWTSAGPIQEIHWGLSAPHAMRARKDRFAGARPSLLDILASARVNPEWVKIYTQFQQQLYAQFNAAMGQGYANIAAAGAMSRQISANNDAMIGAMDSARAQHNLADAAARAAAQQATGRDSAGQFSDYIRGVNTYDDPYWGQSQHSTDHAYVWSDGQGQYRYSNDAGFDPNVGSTGSWQQLARK